MARSEKMAVVDEIAKKIERAQSLYLTDFSGLDVESINELRRLLRQNSIEYRVVKNTLARLAAVKAGRDDLKPYLVGPTALAFGYHDPILPAKILSRFAAKNGKPEVKAILFEGQIFEKQALERLVALPSRDELIARMLGGLKSPLAQTVMVLKGLLRNLVAALNALSQKRAEAGDRGGSGGAENMAQSGDGVQLEETAMPQSASQEKSREAPASEERETEDPEELKEDQPERS